MDSASPDEMLRAAAAPDEIGWDDVSDYDPELENGEDAELLWEAKVPDPFEGPRDSFGAGEIDKIASLVNWRRPTRRKVVSIIYRIFDPLGLLTLITVKFKIILQKLIKAGLGWDESLQDELTKEAGAVLEEMVLMKDVFYPRSLKPAGFKVKVKVRSGE